jgi:hypothetical protein
LHPSRATLAAFVSSHTVSPSFPNLLLHLFISSRRPLVPHCKVQVQVLSRPARLFMAPALGRCSIHAARRRTVTLILADLAPLLNAGSVL